jgi:hypothetical protein
MQRSKRGNPHKSPRNRKKACLPVAQPLERVRLTLHEVDPITGNEDIVYTLFYEFYRGYTIYSSEQGRCCIHGRHGGCLRMQGKFACFPDIEDAKTRIKRFLAEGYTSSDPVERSVPEGEFVCLNWREQQLTPTSSRPIQRVS